MIKVVLFDADGVLINGEMFSQQMTRKYGITYDQTVSFYSGTFRDCLVGVKDLKQEITPFLEQWGWKKSVDEFLDEWFKYEHHTDSRLIAYAQQLRHKGIICAVASNQEKYRVQYISSQMKFSDYFDKLYFSSNIGAQKPDAMFFEKVFADLGGVAKEDVIFWDDSPTHVETGKQFGFIAELYVDYEDFIKRMAAYV